MLKTITSGFRSEKEKISDRINGVGQCLLCSDKVMKSDDYLSTAEGCVHRECWSDWRPQGE